MSPRPGGEPARPGAERAAGIERIVSGGQTGVDRAALDAALGAGFECGGWCPRGRLAEDGPIPARYPLVETSSADYAQRTRANVRDSDGTLILCLGTPGGGTALTLEHARRIGRALRVVDLADPGDPRQTLDWCAREGLRTLNVAGPRASGCPRTYALARGYLDAMLAVTGAGFSRGTAAP